MPTSYAYKVRDRDGKMAAGSMEAESEEAVVGRLRQLGYALISIEPDRAPASRPRSNCPAPAGSSSRTWLCSHASSPR